MLKTIKAQIILVSVILTILLLSQVFLSRSIRATFVDSLDLTQEAVLKVSLVRELERDVIDLQRNVLIYKESASESAINRFNTLMKRNQQNLTSLEDLTAHQAQKDVYHDYILRMRAHLQEYDENFGNVIIGRTKRQYIHKVGILAELESIFNQLKVNQTSTTASMNQIRYHLARAQNFLLQYLVTPEQELVTSFQSQLKEAKIIALSQLEQSNQLQPVLDKLLQVESDFLQLSQITRGYLFLVNVVMAGSANEFLFLARELNRLVTENFTETNINVKQSVEDTQIRSDLFSAFGILLALSTALFLGYRIMVPIKNITVIFEKLAKGKDIETIHGLDRKDEIGQLAQSASVFHEKNKQTTVLLEQSQMLNSKQEALNQQLMISNRAAEQATASKSIFLANMSHEIRTPMNGIIGMLDVILSSDLTAEQREKLDKVAYSGKILLSLINDILDFSKIEAGKLDIENVEFSINSVLANTLANISTRAKEKNLNVLFYVNPEIPNTLIGDPLRITQVLLNLCSNSIKFTNHGSVNIEVDLIDSNQADSIKLSVKVIDTGIGMSKEQVNKVFDSFTQADGSTSRNFGGTGLGLTIVKQLINLMHGEISLLSKPGKGSTFSLMIPLHISRNATAILPMQKITDGKLYYFSESRKGLLYSQYIERTCPNYHHFPLSAISEHANKITAEDAVIIDVASLPAFKKFHQLVIKIKEKTDKIGFITNSQPSNLPSQLTSLWSAECLTHPFVPHQAADFLAHVFSSTNIMQDPTLIKLDGYVQQTYLGHILLVEDNHINQAVAGEMLKILGISYDTAEDGLQAVTKVTNSPYYDLILMDIQMPIMDGYEATQEIRKHGHKDLIICGLSANAMKEDYTNAKKIGMNDYITKPLKLKSLEALVKKYLKSTKP
ncbi:ATP-binding protein [Paraglaciecola sp. L3A3]|uniref:ATP-binding protein n=1 Tax=Paraglaciecola sp. L3A3 TaxID=2686358 RepID=UPI00131BD177|nr:ATP-binding protein [Paraglaciecola sp. L3A3]